MRFVELIDAFKVFVDLLIGLFKFKASFYFFLQHRTVTQGTGSQELANLHSLLCFRDLIELVRNFFVNELELRVATDWQVINIVLRLIFTVRRRVVASVILRQQLCAVRTSSNLNWRWFSRLI